MPLASIADLNGPPEEVARCIEQAKTLSAMYDEFLQLEQDKPDDGHRKPGVHASELYPCLRKPFYSLTRVEPRRRVSKFWLQRFKVGTAIHQMMQDDFHRMAKRSQKQLAMRLAEARAEELDADMQFADEVKVSPDHQALAKHYQLYSSADGVFTFTSRTPEKQVVLRIGLEIKTESPDQYAQLKGPKPEHVRQAHLYMAALDLPLMWFFYMNKGNQNNTNSNAPYLIVWQPKVWAELEDRIKTVHEYVARNEMPERNETIVCEFCPWNYTCLPSKLNAQSSPKPATRRETIRRPGG
jgi:CRISPR/Cas system-associated exonuclease Cas4 (RecB family)